MKPVTYQNCLKSDEQAITDFLWSMRSDFHFSERAVVDEIVQLLFAHGGIIGGYASDRSCLDTPAKVAMVGMFGYFLGEPARQYGNPEIGFVYIAGLAPAYRSTRTFWNGICFGARTLQALGVVEIRCHARAGDAYTNRLYSRLLQPIGREENRRGDICILYAASLNQVLAHRRQPHRQRTPRPPAPAIVS